MDRDRDEGAGAGSEAVGALAESLKDPQFRRAFAADPEGALAQQDIPRAEIDAQVLEVLGDLSPQELAVLARVRKTLVDAGVPPHIRAEMV